MFLLDRVGVCTRCATVGGMKGNNKPTLAEH